MKPVSVPLLMIASVALHLGSYHLFVALRARERAVDLAFGIYCFTAAAFAMGESLLLAATTAEQAFLPGYFQDTFGLALFGAFLAFARQYTGEGDPRLVRALIGALLLSIVVVSFGPREWVIAPPGFVYRQMDAAAFTFGMYESAPGIGTRVIQAFALANGIAAFWLGVRHLRTNPRRARPLLGATIFGFVAAFHDLAIEAGLVSGLYWFSFVFVGQAVVMAFVLADDVLRAAVTDAKLRRSEERLELAVAGSADGIFDWDLTNGAVYYSPRFAEILGAPVEALDAAGTDPFSLVAIQDLPRLQSSIAKRIADDDRLDVEFALHEPAGDRWLRLRARAVRDAEGRPHRFAGALSDVTERRRVEARVREAQNLESVGRLAGGVAHDFNNMLAGVVAYADLLRNDPSLSERGKESAERIVEAGQRAAELTARLLAFSRKPSGVTASVNVHKAIESALGLLERTIDRRIAIETDLAARDHFVVGDAARIESAILNLGVNARDAMPDGGTLRVTTADATLGPDERESLRIESGASSFLRIEVHDSGAGMGPELLSRIFEPFFTTKAIGEGTGLGLSSVKATAEDMQGAVTVTSETGRGTTVALLVPTTAPTDRREPSVEASTARFDGIALVVDDEELVRKAIRATLETTGFEVLEAENGPEGVDVLRRNRERIRVVVMDLVMPTWSADTTYGALRAEHATVPILLVSGFRGDAKVDELLAAGAAAFLAKPFRTHALVETLKRILPSGASRDARRDP